MLRLPVQVCLCLLAAFCCSGFSQAPAPLPSDPAALMELAHNKNGLAGPGIRPWHVHGTFRSYDEKGKSENEGIYEEWWLSPSRYKRSFSSSSLTQTDIADGTDLFRDGQQDWPHGDEIALRERLINPVLSDDALKPYTLQERTQPAGSSKAVCVLMLYPVRANLNLSSDYFPVSCFESTIPLLRVSSTGRSTKVIYDQFVNFQGHYFAKKVQIYAGTKLQAELTLDAVKLIANPSDQILVPSASAKKVDLSNIFFTASVGQRYPTILKMAFPEYPAGAKSSRIQGTVVLRASINKDGHLVSAKVISGPPALRQTSLDAVKQWIYLPPEVLGERRSFEIEIKVIFTLA
jgi:TonB family protein